MAYRHLMVISTVKFKLDVCLQKMYQANLSTIHIEQTGKINIGFLQSKRKKKYRKYRKGKETLIPTLLSEIRKYKDMITESYLFSNQNPSYLFKDTMLEISNWIYWIYFNILL